MRKRTKNYRSVRRTDQVNVGRGNRRGRCDRRIEKMGVQKMDIKSVEEGIVETQYKVEE